MGFADASQILRTCTASGRLLHPSRPMTVLDSGAAAAAFPGVASGPAGPVYATYSLVSGWAWSHVLAAELPKAYAVTPGDLAAINADIALRATGALQPPAVAATHWRSSDDAGVVAYSINATTFDASSLVVAAFSEAAPIALAPCMYDDFVVVHTAPVFANGWAILGDLSKWVPVAEARVSQVRTDAGGVYVDIVGQAGEAVPLTFWDTASASATTVACILPAIGAATVSVPAGTCV